MYLFGCTGSLSFAQAFSSCREQGLLLLAAHGLLWGSTGSRHAGFSSCSAGSVVVAHGLLLPSMWDLHRPGIKPVSFASFALQGRFLTTGPPGKPRKYSYIYLSTFLYSPFYIKCPLCFGDVAIWQNKSSLFVVLNLYYIGNVVVHIE